MGVIARRTTVRALAALSLAVLAAGLTGCAPVVENATQQLEAEMGRFEFVEYIFSSSAEGTLFDEAYSSISVDIEAGTTADELDDLVTYWRFGVDGIDARWRLGITRPGGEGTDSGYDDFSVAGVRSVADLTALARYWHSLGERTESAGVSIHDYSPDQDGFIQIDYPAQPSSSLHEIVTPLAADALELPGRFQWSVTAPIPSGRVDVAGMNVLPDAHMLDVLAAIADVPAGTSPGPIAFTAIDSVRDFGPVREPRLYIDVALPTDDMAVLQFMVDQLAHEERAVVLDFSVAGEGVAHLDPFQCSTQDSEEIYGPLTYDLWQYWLRGRASTPDGSTADTCHSYD